VERTKYELAINLKTAKSPGLTIPQSLPLRANQLAERFHAAQHHATTARRSRCSPRPLSVVVGRSVRGSVEYSSARMLSMNRIL
jgi:hypothetical protein